MQLFVHPWNAEEEVWAPEPAAFTQGTVTPRKMVNGGLFIFTSATTDHSTAADQRVTTLPRGKYLVKAYLDAKGRLARDPAVLLTEEDYFGQAELKRARWREGFRQAEVIPGKSLQRD